jgi:hypothetical protein
VQSRWQCGTTGTYAFDILKGKGNNNSRSDLCCCCTCFCCFNIFQGKDNDSPGLGCCTRRNGSDGSQSIFD